MALELTSPAFTHEGEIPAPYTCDGETRSPAPALYTHDEEDRSPELNWSGLPAGTKSLTLIMAESDNTASARTACVHWILYDLPPHATGLTEAAKPQDLPAGSREGLNNWKHLRYDGPCSPIERRRYNRRHAIRLCRSAHSLVPPLLFSSRFEVGTKIVTCGVPDCL
jgi:Raf kinase inhibitor-like YbhB/YbcL family protein